MLFEISRKTEWPSISLLLGDAVSKPKKKNGHHGKTPARNNFSADVKDTFVEATLQHRNYGDAFIKFKILIFLKRLLMHLCKSATTRYKFRFSCV